VLVVVRRRVTGYGAVRWKRWLGPLLVALVVAGCEARSSGRVEPIVDLAALLPYTDDAARTEEIHPGDPAHRKHLLRGWSAPVAHPDGPPRARFVGGRTATHDFQAGHKPRQLTVHDARTLDPPGPAPRK
jgi:hypothetical protein